MRRGKVAVFLATSGHSGVDRIMGNMVPEMARQGVEVDLLRIRGHGPEVREHPPGLRVVELPCSHVNSALPHLVSYLRRERPTALLSDKDRVNRAAIWASILAGVGTRVVVRVGTTVSENLRKRPFWARQGQLLSIRLFYGRAGKVLVPSQGAREDLAALAPALAPKIEVVPSPIIHRSFAARAREPIRHPWFGGDGIPVVLGVGELCERKDFATLIRGFGLAAREMEMRLLILGEGRKRRELEALVEDLGLAKRVEMPGFCPNPLPYMAAASCFCLTSRCEGLPVALVEALACGTPVVATDCPSGPREVIGPSRAGRLVPVGDPEALAQAILQTLKDPPSREEARAAAAPFTVEAGTAAYLRALLG